MSESLDEQMTRRIAAGECVGCGVPMKDKHPDQHDWTTCIDCQHDFERQAHEYWNKIYKAGNN